MTWKHFKRESLNQENPLYWFCEEPIWPFLRDLQPPQPPKFSGVGTLEFLIDVSNWASAKFPKKKT